MLMLVVWAANVAIGLFALGAVMLGANMGTDFCLGVLAGTVVYNVAHRIIYGRWL